MVQPNGVAAGIVGATGAVGLELRSILAQQGFPPDAIRLAARQSRPSDLIEPLSEAFFEGLEVAFFCTPAAVSRQWAPVALRHRCTVVDNSSAFRQEPDVPLVIPTINGEVVDAIDEPAIIANPNCSTIIALMAITPIHRAVGIRRMSICTYQAVSGAGRAWMSELEQQSRDHAHGRPYTMSATGRQLLFNVFSHDSAIGDDGYNQEERKLIRETRRIWRTNDVAITATCVRVPVLRTHSEAINLTLGAPFSPDEVRELLRASPGIRVVDDRESNRFPESIDAAGQDDVLVGRVRGDVSQPSGYGLELFVCGDQLRRGAATNAWEIWERSRRASTEGAGCGNRGLGHGTSDIGVG